MLGNQQIFFDPTIGAFRNATTGQIVGAQQSPIGSR
jgi:hypothetical protein